MKRLDSLRYQHTGDLIAMQQSYHTLFGSRDQESTKLRIYQMTNIYNINTLPLSVPYI